MSLTTYERIFGTGPRGAVVTFVTLGGAVVLDVWLGLPAVHGNAAVSWTALILGAAAGFAIAGWSVYTLPPAARGRALVTGGPFRYVRHPLYAALLGPFDLGSALFFDGWIFLAWAVLQYPIWHLNIGAEERLMRGEFGDEYDEYCRKTGRFLPKLATLAAHSGN